MDDFAEAAKPKKTIKLNVSFSFDAAFLESDFAELDLPVVEKKPLEKKPLEKITLKIHSPKKNKDKNLW